jgi:hypothetical protein
MSCDDPYEKNADGTYKVDEKGNKILKSTKIDFQQALLPHFILG